MKIAKGLEKYTAEDIGTLAITTNLHKKDVKSDHRLLMTGESIGLLQQNLTMFRTSEREKIKKKLTLHIRITRCSEGSSLGRLACGECGLGWALFFLDWHVTDEQNEILIGPEVEKFRDSGLGGFADFNDDTVGDRAIRAIASIKAPDRIKGKIEIAFRK